MNDELVQKLKDNGFPTRITEVKKQDTVWQHPTLEELIEACGEGFNVLRESKDGWKVEGFNVEGIYSKTPEETVALLWLELNKK